MNGVLITNLGSPEAPEAPEVRRYLKEFLMDPWVIDIPWLPRWLLVNGIIAPFRAPKSAEAYRAIWTKHGSPLKVTTEQLGEKLQARLPQYKVAWGMRYGTPSLRESMLALDDAGCSKIRVLPLYPQYAESSVRTTIEALKALQGDLKNIRMMEVLPPFYAEKGFAMLFARRIAPSIEAIGAQHVLFSYHGLPERHVKKTDPTAAYCLRSRQCCETAVEANKLCYRHHCWISTQNITSQLNLPANRYSMSFQSRLGRDPWIQPFTDKEFEEFPKRGIKRLVVVCPSFVADCLETLEEIRIRGEEIFRKAGGKVLEMVPSLNADDDWVEWLAGYLDKPPAMQALPLKRTQDW
jgi:ferrochelatase